MIAGKMVLKDGEFTSINEKAVLSELRDMQDEFMNNYKKILPLSEEIFQYVEKSYWKCIEKNDELWRFSATKNEYDKNFRQEF